MSQASPRLEIDSQAFAHELSALHKELVQDLRYEDFAEFRRMERCGKLATALGYLTAWIIPNPISAFLISLGNLTRWMLMHHISHRGFDQVPGVPARYTSARFAKGARRWLDWFDWVIPEAWAYEHNVMHHYNTGEIKDPDVIEHNMESLLSPRTPRWQRYLFTGAVALTWKLTYYAPKTLLELQRARARRAGGNVDSEASLALLINPFTAAGREFLTRSFFPYFIFRFIVLPALFLPLGGHAALYVLINSVAAEAMTNLHSFMVITPNHTGADLYRFGRPSSGKDEFFVRQALGSANYTGGTFLSDYLQAGLNYQIEHHFWPDLPLSKYRVAQPRVEAICKKHGVPYRCESIFIRLKHTVDIFVGKTRMLQMDGLAPSLSKLDSVPTQRHRNPVPIM